MQYVKLNKEFKASILIHTELMKYMQRRRYFQRTNHFTEYESYTTKTPQINTKYNKYLYSDRIFVKKSFSQHIYKLAQKEE